jgi:hypothetical protein
MSANARGRITGFTPRVVRLRNRCLQSIARRRSLPVPSQADLEKIGDQVALSEAVKQWMAAHGPEQPKSRGGFDLPPRPPARWRSPVVIRVAAVFVAAVMGIIAGRQLLPRADAQSRDGSIEQLWLAVTDSVAEEVNTTVRRVNDDNRRTQLTAADVAALIFRSPRRRTVVVDSMTARADSMIAIRGQLAAGATFELHGDLRLIRRGIGELVVQSLRVDGTSIDPTMTSRLLARGRARTEDSDRVRFDVPLNVTAIAVIDGTISMTRDELSSGPGARVVR